MLSGSMTQGGSTLKHRAVIIIGFLALLVCWALEKDAAPTPAEKRKIEEVEVRISTRDGRVPFLAGTLFLPLRSPPHPGAILVAGSGQTDRYWNNTYIPGDVSAGRALAHYLAESGIAVLSFDKRGVGESPVDPELTAETRIRDLEAAFDFLKGHPHISPGCAALVGHSEGAGLALRVATAREDVAALVMLAGMGFSGHRLLQDQVTRNVLEPEGIVGKEAETNLRYVEASLEATFEARALPTQGAEVHPKVAELVRALVVKPEVKGCSVCGMNFNEDPTDHVRRVKVPLMIIGGGRDVQIDRRHFDSLRSAAPSARAVFYENMDHMMKVEERETLGLSGKEVLARYAEARPIHPEMLKDLVTFLKDSFACR